MNHLFPNMYDSLGKNRTHQENNNYNSNNRVQFDNKINTIIDFFLFDNYENIKSKKELSNYEFINHNFFFLFIEQNGRYVQKGYNINDFIQNYYFIKIENNPKNQILRDINSSIYKKDIYKDLKINNSNNLELYLINNQRNTSDNIFNIIFNIRENSSNSINDFNKKNKLLIYIFYII